MNATRNINIQENTETLVEIIRTRASEHGDHMAIRMLGDGETETGQLTYQGLDKRARMVAAQLQIIAEPGDRVLLLLEPGLDFIVSFFGCLYAKCVAVPAYPPVDNRYLSRVQAIIADAEAKVILTSSTVAEKFQTPDKKIMTGLEKFRIIIVDSLREVLSDDWIAGKFAGDDIAFLQYTSGSTGSPKGVTLTHQNILANLRMIRKAMRLHDKAIMVSWLPVYHDMGLIGGILEELSLGCTSILMPPAAFLQRPIRWLQAITKYRATISGGPNFAYDLCTRRIKEEELPNLDLSSLEVLYSGAEPIRAKTLERFIGTFSRTGLRATSLFPCYGLAETTLYVSGTFYSEQASTLAVDKNSIEQGSVRILPAPDAQQDHKALVSCGLPAEQERVLVVNPESREKCEPGTIGEIWVSGSHVSQGYWNKPELNAEVFKATLAGGDSTSFLRTGDLGFLHDGQVFITGRLKDLIIISGRNHYPQDIELTVEQSHPALRPGCCVAFALENARSEEVGVVAEIERTQLEADFEQIAQAILTAVSMEHEIPIAEIVFLKPGRLPKTSSGKVQRRLTRKTLMDGSLETHFRWSSRSEHPTGTVQSEPVIPRNPENQLGRLALGDAEILKRLLSQLGATPEALERIQVDLAAIKAQAQIQAKTPPDPAINAIGKLVGFGIFWAAASKWKEQITEAAPLSDFAAGAYKLAKDHLSATLQKSPTQASATKPSPTAAAPVNTAPKSTPPVTPAQANKTDAVSKPANTAKPSAPAKPLNVTPATDMTQESILAQLQAWLAKSLEIRVEAIEPTRALNSYGVDSVVAMELIAQVEETYGIKLPQSLLWNYPTTQAIAGFLLETMSTNAREKKK